MKARFLDHCDSSSRASGSDSSEAGGEEKGEQIEV